MRIRTLAAVTFLAAFCSVSTRAQATVPILSGGVGFFSSTSSGSTTMQPVISPVLTVPIGSRWLIESRADLRGVVFPGGPNKTYQAQFFPTFEYGQVDFLATHWLTITAGRFLTPFNMFNERLGPIWIHKFQDVPIIFPIGTTQGYSDGVMLRGALVSRDSYQILYTAYFSTLDTVEKLSSQRSSGGRASVFFPKERLEIGTSYARLLQGQQMNFEGAFFNWQPYPAPLDMKAEYAHSPRGQGYWIEAGYRIAKSSSATTGLARLEALGRVQQFQRLQAGTGDSLPGLNTQRVDVGADYRFPHEVRLTASYGRQNNSASGRNIFEFGITYRMLFPLFPGGSQ
jgi:hypothetical protein